MGDTEIGRVLALTEGWPAGVALLGDQLSSDKPKPVSSLELSDYLAAEIFGRLPEELREFLLWTSVFDNLEAAGCDAVLETNGASRHLEALEKQNIPAMRVEGAGVEYRVHPLFRDFLRARLMVESPQRHADLNRRAGAWQATRGRFADAIWHFSKAGDWDRAVELIEQEAPRAYRRGRWHLVTSWIELLPARELERRPHLRVWEARILVRLGQTTTALRVITETIRALPPSDQTILAELETLQGTALRVKGDVRSALVSCQRAVDLASRGNAPIEVVAEARKQLGQAYFSEGSFAEAAKELTAVLDIYERMGDVEEAAFVNGCLGSALRSLRHPFKS